MKPKVTVCVVTYNQEKYIRACIESLIDQDADFDYEIIVGDDCSSDGTSDILNKLSEKYPNKIILVLRSKNIGTVSNCLDLYRRAKGQYICHIDGDDLAYKNKLSIQARTLDTNPDCHICSHNMDLIDSDGIYLQRTYKNFKTGSYGLADLLETLPFFSHSSKMFRNDLNLPFWDALDPMALDIEVHVEQVKLGRIYHINEPSGAYRILTGVTIKNNKISQHILDGNKRLFENLMRIPDLNQKNIAKFYAKTLFKLAYQFALLGNNTGATDYIRKSLNIRPYSLSQLIFAFGCSLGLSPFGVKLITTLQNFLNKR